MNRVILKSRKNDFHIKKNNSNTQNNRYVHSKCINTFHIKIHLQIVLFSGKKNSPYLSISKSFIVRVISCHDFAEKYYSYSWIVCNFRSCISRVISSFSLWSFWVKLNTQTEISPLKIVRTHCRYKKCFCLLTFSIHNTVRANNCTIL